LVILYGNKKGGAEWEKRAPVIFRECERGWNIGKNRDSEGQGKWVGGGKGRGGNTCVPCR